MLPPRIVLRLDILHPRALDANLLFNCGRWIFFRCVLLNLLHLVTRERLLTGFQCRSVDWDKV